MGEKRFELLKNPTTWRRLAIANWKAPNDPTVYFAFPIEFTAAQRFLDKVNSEGTIKITPTHLVTKAVALTLCRFPALNGIIKWRRIYLRKSVDIFLQVAIAEQAAGERPDLSGAKIANCDTKELWQIATELKEKSQAIRDKSDPHFKMTLNLLNKMPTLFLSWAVRGMAFLIYNLGLDFPRFGLPADPFGSAMVTSVGALGMASGFAPLAPMSRVPLIVCVGEVTERPWVVAGQVEARPVIDLSITCDHRFIDGLSGARMAEYFKAILENPAEYLV